MKTLLQIIIIAGLCLTKSFAVTGSLTLKDKCHKSDVIVRGVVIDIISLSHPTNKTDLRGPRSIALFQVGNVFKGEAKKIGPVILIPCNYNFDPSPSDFTKSKEYIIFLESMGYGYYHPLNTYCMHRVKKDRVGMSGFDWEAEFDSESKNAKTIPLKEFILRIKTALQNKANKSQ